MKFLALFVVICSVAYTSAYPYPIPYPYSSGFPVSSGLGSGGVGVPSFGGLGSSVVGLHHGLHQGFVVPPPSPIPASFGSSGILHHSAIPAQVPYTGQGVGVGLY